MIRTSFYGVCGNISQFVSYVRQPFLLGCLRTILPIREQIQKFVQGFYTTLCCNVTG